LKVFVIGVDGAPLGLIQSWVNSGDLPTFKKLMDEGVSGELKSAIPPISPTSWASFMTGKNPGKHGILDFAFLRINGVKSNP